MPNIDEQIAELLQIAKANKVDEAIVNRIAAKLAEQRKPSEAESKPHDRPAVVLLEPRALTKAKDDTQAARERNELIQRDWDRVACWDATGNCWERGGKPDDSFYQQTQVLFTTARRDGLTREQIVANHINSHVKPKRATPPKAEKTKTVTKSVKTIEVIEQPKSKPDSPPKVIAVPPKKVSQFSFHHAIEPQIDWSAADDTKKKKKQRSKNTKDPNQSATTENEILPIQLAENEALFLDDMGKWRSKLEKPTQLHDDICEDVRKFSLFLIFLGIGTTDELLNIDFIFGGHNNNANRDSIFTTNDADARIVRNNIMHKFPTDQLLVSTYNNIVANNLGPRLRAYQKSKTVLMDLPAVDLTKSELFNYELAVFDVNARILDLFARITNYVASLEKEINRQIMAFKLLDQQNHAKPLSDDGQINFTHVEVYTARAIESCLIWLGKLHTLYIEQEVRFKTLPGAMTTFIADVYKNIRNIFAHEVADNAQWHYSPIDVKFIQDYMKIAVVIFKDYKTELAQKPIAPAAPTAQNRLRLALAAQPFVPHEGNNNNNAEVTKLKYNPAASAFVPNRGS